MTLVLALLASAVLGPAFAQPPQQPAVDVPAAPSRADQRLLDTAFRAAFSKDQLAAFKQPPSPEQLADRMNPEQRQKARQELARLEDGATKSADLEELARGYLILDQRGGTSAKDLLRVAQRLKAVDPKNAKASTIATQALLEMGQYDAAIKASGEAVRRNPNDANAKALRALALAKGRPIGDVDTKRFEKAFASPGVEDQAIAGSGGPRAASRNDLPVRLPVQVRPDATVVPSVVEKKTGGTPTKGRSPLLPLGTAGAGVVMLGAGAYAAKKGGSGEAGADDAPPTRSTMDTLSDYVFRAKLAIEDHPYQSVGLAAGAVLLTGGLASIGLSAGGGLLLDGGSVAALAPAAAASPVGVTVVQAGGALAAGSVALMAHQPSADPNESKGNDEKSTQEPGKKRPTPRSGTGKPGVSRAPKVADPELQRYLNELYRPGADVGNGGTADAVRFEKDTGNLLSRAGHTTKAETYAKCLQRWLNTHPAAAAADRATALAEMNDLLQALNGD